MKRTVFAGAAFGLLLLLSISSTAQEIEKPGDVNNDGVVNILDLTLVASHLGKSVESTEVNLDVNADGVLNILDVVFVGNIIGGAPSAATPRGGTLIFGRGGDSITLDPAQLEDGESAKVCDLLYDTLVQYRDDTTELAPALAEAWDSSADGLTWRFHLREGVQFHDGTLCDAEAVVFSLTRPQVLARNFHKEFIDQITALDALTVEVVLKKPYAPFISTLAITSFSIVSPIAVAKYGDAFTNTPVGTGPFKFVRWDRNDKIVLSANTAHWAGKPSMDTLVFRSIPDNSVRLMELQQGNIHIMEFPNPDELGLIQSDPQLSLITQTGLNIGYLAMNTAKPPFDNPQVRLAINHAIDKATIVEHLYQGTGTPAKNPIPPALWSYDDTIEDHAYDPELAKQLLADAGYPDGFETTLWALPVPRPYIPDGLALGQVLQSELRNVGITAKIITFDWGTYLEKIRNGEHDIAMLGWSADTADPDNFFFSLLSIPAAEKPAAFNIAFYRSDEMQAVLEQARVSTDPIERVDLYEKAQAIFHNDVPWVPFAHAHRLLVINRKVQHVRLAPIGWKYLRNVSLTE